MLDTTLRPILSPILQWPGLWPVLQLGGKQLFVIILLKCVVSIQLFSCHWLRRSLPDLKSYMLRRIDVYSSMAGFIWRKSRKCRWERADQEASATGSYTILQSAHFTAPVPKPRQPADNVDCPLHFSAQAMSDRASICETNGRCVVPNQSSSVCVWSYC